MKVRSKAETDSGCKSHTDSEHFTTLEDSLSFEKSIGSSPSTDIHHVVIDSLRSFESKISLSPFGLEVSELVLEANLLFSVR